MEWEPRRIIVFQFVVDQTFYSSKLCLGFFSQVGDIKYIIPHIMILFDMLTKTIFSCRFVNKRSFKFVILPEKNQFTERAHIQSIGPVYHLLYLFPFLSSSWKYQWWYLSCLFRVQDIFLPRTIFIMIMRRSMFSKKSNMTLPALYSPINR